MRECVTVLPVSVLGIRVRPVRPLLPIRQHKHDLGQADQPLTIDDPARQSLSIHAAADQPRCDVQTPGRVLNRDQIRRKCLSLQLLWRLWMCHGICPV